MPTLFHRTRATSQLRVADLCCQVDGLVFAACKGQRCTGPSQTPRGHRHTRRSARHPLGRCDNRCEAPVLRNMPVSVVSALRLRMQSRFSPTDIKLTRECRHVAGSQMPLSSNKYARPVARAGRGPYGRPQCPAPASPTWLAQSPPEIRHERNRSLHQGTELGPFVLEPLQVAQARSAVDVDLGLLGVHLIVVQWDPAASARLIGPEDHPQYVGLRLDLEVVCDAP